MSDIPYVDIVKSRRRNWEAYAHSAIGALEEALAASEARATELDTWVTEQRQVLDKMLERLSAMGAELVMLRQNIGDIMKSALPAGGTTLADTAEAMASRLDYIRFRAEGLLSIAPHAKAIDDVLNAALKWFRRKRDYDAVDPLYTVEEHELYRKLKALEPSEAPHDHYYAPPDDDR